MLAPAPEEYEPYQSPPPSTNVITPQPLTSWVIRDITGMHLLAYIRGLLVSMPTTWCTLLRAAQCSALCLVIYRCIISLSIEKIFCVWSHTWAWQSINEDWSFSFSVLCHLSKCTCWSQPLISFFSTVVSLREVWCDPDYYFSGGGINLTIRGR